jgi:hypothetical protein
MKLPNGFRALAALALISISCVPVLEYNTTAVTIVPSPLAGKVDSTGDAHFRRFGLEIRLIALDAVLTRDIGLQLRAGSGFLPPTLMLLVTFEPIEGAYWFDPTKVMVQPQGGDPTPPSGYVGPGIFSVGDDWNGVSRGCFPESGPRSPIPLERKTDALRHAIVRGVCFVLAFPVRARSTADLTLAGIGRGSQPLPDPPVLHLARRAFRSTLIAERPRALEPAEP